MMVTCFDFYPELSIPEDFVRMEFLECYCIPENEPILKHINFTGCENDLMQDANAHTISYGTFYHLSSCYHRGSILQAYARIPMFTVAPLNTDLHLSVGKNILRLCSSPQTGYCPQYRSGSIPNLPTVWFSYSNAV